MNPQRRSFALDAWPSRASVRGRLAEQWIQRLARSCFGLSIVLCALAFGESAHAGTCTPQVTITEQVDPQPGGGFLGQYVMTTGDLCGLQIVALAVDNDESVAAFANLSGWNAQVVTDNFWDAGIVLSRDDFGTGSSYLVTTGPAGIGSFVSFFGPYAQLANLYWLSAHYGGPVVDNSTAFTAVGTPIPLPDDAFQFQTGAPASQPLVFLFDPTLGTTVAVSVVPEPEALLLFSMGLAFMMAGRRRAAVVTGCWVRRR